jgi:hypothetical protein
VAEKDPGDAGGGEVPLGSEVFRPNQERRGVGTEDGSIGEELRAGSLGGIDHGFVFRDADALGGEGGRRYEQNACGSGERSGERCGFAIVSFEPARRVRRGLQRWMTEEIPVDLIPFGGVAEADVIHWPPERETVMAVRCRRFALSRCLRIALGIKPNCGERS